MPLQFAMLLPQGLGLLFEFEDSPRSLLECLLYRLFAFMEACDICLPFPNKLLRFDQCLIPDPEFLIGLLQ